MGGEIMFCEGDMLTIVSDLREVENRVGIAVDMLDYEGCLVTISRVLSDNTYLLEDDGGEFTWEDTMFQEYYEQEFTSDSLQKLEIEILTSKKLVV